MPYSDQLVQLACIARRLKLPYNANKCALAVIAEAAGTRRSTQVNQPPQPPSKPQEPQEPQEPDYWQMFRERCEENDRVVK
jgi:hypothetical protein